MTYFHNHFLGNPRPEEFENVSVEISKHMRFASKSRGT